MPKIVITGTGIITAAGTGPGPVLDGMVANAGFFDGSQLCGNPSMLGAWPIAVPDPNAMNWPVDDPWWVDNRKFANLTSQWAVSAALLALDTPASAEVASRCGVIMTLGGYGDEEYKILLPLLAMANEDSRPLATLLYDEMPDYTYVRGIPSQCGQFVAKATGFRGSNVAVYGEATAGGLGAVALAMRLLRSGELERVIVVGVAPVITPKAFLVIDGLDSIGTKATLGCGPFDLNRAGTLLGLGAAALILETEPTALQRGVKPMAELLECEVICGQTSREAINMALDIVLSAIPHSPDIWWAHGAGSVVLDLEECHAVGAMVRAPATSSKGTIGNAFECSGLIDMALACEALHRKSLPPVGLLRTPDPALGDIDFVVGSSRALPDAKTALVTGFGHVTTKCAGAAVIRRSDHG